MDPLSIEIAAHVEKTEAEEIAYRRKSRHRLAIIAVSASLLLLIIAGIAATAIKYSHRSQNTTQNKPNLKSIGSLKAICSTTLYPDSCYTSISSARGPNTNVDNPQEVFKLSVQVAINSVEKATNLGDSVSAGTSDPTVKSALRDCNELFASAAGHLKETLSILQATITIQTSDMRILLSAAVADQVTCSEGLAETPVAEVMSRETVNATEHTSNSLAIGTKFGNYNDLLQTPFMNRRLLVAFDNLPPWASALLRRAPGQRFSEGKLIPNVTVAKDGTGDFENIDAAMEKVPEKSLVSFVIYVKEGVYMENVVVVKSKWNVIMIGDGMNRTIVTGRRNRIDGTTAYKSATFSVEGRGFVAMDMTFKNTAGPEKNQATALISKSDRSTFIRCSFDAFHKTLYAHSLRQFYRDCDIIGTEELISGDAAVVFQNCSIRTRQSLSGQKNTITLQTRSDPNENTGISIQSCIISGFGDVTSATYLGRPGNEFSRTVVVMTEIGSVVVPQGWMEMIDGTVPPGTIFFGEYRNSGPGSKLAGRVSWPGYKPMMSDAEAEQFSVDAFIQGSNWINI